MRTIRLLSMSLVFSAAALGACNLYFGEHADHTTGEHPPDAQGATRDGNYWPVPDAYVVPDDGGSCGGHPDAQPVPDAYLPPPPDAYLPPPPDAPPSCHDDAQPGPDLDAQPDAYLPPPPPDAHCC